MKNQEFIVTERVASITGRQLWPTLKTKRLLPMTSISSDGEKLQKLWEMNPQIDPRNEFECTFEGIKYYHMKEHPEVYRSVIK